MNQKSVIHVTEDTLSSDQIVNGSHGGWASKTLYQVISSFCFLDHIIKIVCHQKNSRENKGSPCRKSTYIISILWERNWPYRIFLNRCLTFWSSRNTLKNVSRLTILFIVKQQYSNHYIFYKSSLYRGCS